MSGYEEISHHSPGDDVADHLSFKGMQMPELIAAFRKGDITFSGFWTTINCILDTELDQKEKADKAQIVEGVLVIFRLSTLDEHIDGNMTFSELDTKLHDIIESECKKTTEPADPLLMASASNLLYHLHTGHPYIPDYGRMGRNEGEMYARIDKKKKRRRYAHYAFHAIPCAAAIIFLLVGLDLVLRHSWLEGESINEKQQYSLQGHIAENTGYMELGLAKGSETQFSMDTTDMEKIATFISYMPAVPQYVPDTWELQQGFVSTSGLYDRVTLTYVQASSGKTAIYEMKHYRDAEDAYSSFEQNTDGEEQELGGLKVYFVQNIERPSFIWHDNLNVYSLAGDMDLEELKLMIQSVEGGSTQ